MSGIEDRLLAAVRDWVRELTNRADYTDGTAEVESLQRAAITSGRLGDLARAFAVFADEPRLVVVGRALRNYDAGLDASGKLVGCTNESNQFVNTLGSRLHVRYLAEIYDAAAEHLNSQKEGQ